MNNFNINYIIHLLTKTLVNIIGFKKVYLYNFLISKFIFNNFCYSIYGVKLFNPNFNDDTFRFCCGGAYGHFLPNLLSKIQFKFRFVDIGANIGIFSLCATKNKNCEGIIAFEPADFIFDNLSKNLFFFKKKKIFKKAISNYEKTGFLHINQKSSGSSRLVEESREGRSVSVVNYKFIENILNSFSINYPLIIKVDTEGNDEVVLKELMKIENINIKYIYTELIHSKSSKENIIDILKNFKLIKEIKIHKKVSDLLFEKIN